MGYNYKKIAKDYLKYKIQNQGEKFVKEFSKRADAKIKEDEFDGSYIAWSKVMVMEQYSKADLRDFYKREQLKKKYLGK